MTKAIVLVGGQGTRLRPLTLRTAKPLLPTAGRPFLEYQLLRLRAVGITEVVMATSYQASTFAHTFGDGAQLGMSVQYAVETQPLGTGGAIANAGALLGQGGPDEPVVILNGDILSDLDLAAHLALHTQRNAQLSLHLTEVADPRAFGCVPTDADGRVLQFLEKTENPPTRHINAGCYIFSRHLIDAIPRDQVVSVERETFPQLLANQAAVWAYTDDTYWLDVGTPAAYVKANADLVQGHALAGISGLRPSPAWLGTDAQVDPSAVLEGGSVVEEACRIGAGSHLVSTVIAPGTNVGENTQLTRCALGQGVQIGSGCTLDGVVVGDGAIIGDDVHLTPGLRVWTDAVLPTGSLRLC